MTENPLRPTPPRPRETGTGSRRLPPPARQRVTGPRSPPPGTKPAEAGAPSRDVGAIYLRTLVRAQLRLAVVCCVGFIVALAAAGALIATVPALQQGALFGVPLAWLLQAYGLYPLIALFAVLYVRAAARNERRYRLLEESG